MDVDVRETGPTDAFAVGALTIQCERERGHPCPPGFLDAFADAWLTDPARVGMLALDGDGRPLGVVHGAVVTKLPSPSRPRERWLHVSLLFVTPSARGQGLGERLMTELLAWCRTHRVTRVQLHAEEAARTLYARVGFGPAPAEHLEIRLG